MALDTRIPLGVQPPQIQPPMEAYAQVLNLQRVQQQIADDGEERRQRGQIHEQNIALNKQRLASVEREAADAASTKQKNETALKIAHGLRDPDPQAREVVLKTIQDPTIQETARQMLLKRDEQNGAYRKERAQFAQKLGYPPELVRVIVALDPLPNALDHFNHYTKDGTDTDAIKRYVDAFASEGEKPSAPHVVGSGGALVGDHGNVLYQNQPRPATPPAVGSFEDYVARKYGANPTDAQILEGRKVYQQADDRPRVNVTVGGANSAGNWDLQGEEFLKTIPPQWRETVKKIARYDEDPTKVASMRGGMRETLTQWVNQVNPAYDQSQFALRSPTRKAFTTGTQGQQINAINTAIGHIDQLTALSDKLQNGGFVPGNQAWNTVRTMFGSDKVTNFDTLKDALASEVASVLSKGGATVSGIAEARDHIKAASSPAALAGYVKTQIPIMGSKLASLDYQYHQAMGDSDTFSALSPQSKQILTKFGFDPAHPTIGGTDVVPKEGETKPIDGYPGTEQTYRGGKWIRTK